ncbi:MAG: hypothetical protein R3D83_08805 [Caenibius sp.]
MMEEKSLLRAGFGEGDVLRPIAWSELAARLSALRAVRGSAVREHGNAVCSFDSGAARQLGTFAHGEPDVNPNDLGNGKGAGRTVAAVEGDGTSGDRGKE